MPACVTSALGSFFSAASGLQDTIASVAAQMAQVSYLADAWSAAGLASEAGSYAVELEDLASSITSASDGVQAAVDELDDVLNSVNQQLAGLGEMELRDFGAINQKYFEAYQYSRLQSLRNILRSAARVVQRVVQVGANTPAAQSLLASAKADFGVWTVSTGAVSVGTWSLAQFGAATTSDLDDLVANNGTSNTTTNGTDTSQNGTNRVHFILFSPGFSLPLFDVICETLDGSAGVKTANDSELNEWILKNGGNVTFGPGYTTNISQSVGLIMAKMPFVDTVYMHPTPQEQVWLMSLEQALLNLTEPMPGSADDSTNFFMKTTASSSSGSSSSGSSSSSSSSPPSSSSPSTSSYSSGSFPASPSSPEEQQQQKKGEPFWKRLDIFPTALRQIVELCWQKGLARAEQKFRADASLGQGVTIFALDNGVNMTRDSFVGVSSSPPPLLLLFTLGAPSLSPFSSVSNHLY